MTVMESWVRKAAGAACAAAVLVAQLSPAATAVADEAPAAPIFRR